jgi:uncharacterized protein DUF6582
MARTSSRMTAKKRRSLPKSQFAYPAQRKYPIDTRARARNALARAAQSHTMGTYAHVAAAVKRRYPDIGVRGKTKTTTRTRTARRTRNRRSRRSSGRRT